MNAPPRIDWTFIDGSPASVSMDRSDPKYEFLTTSTVGLNYRPVIIAPDNQVANHQFLEGAALARLDPPDMTTEPNPAL